MTDVEQRGVEQRDVEQRGADTLDVDPMISPGYRLIARMRRGNDYDTYDAWSEQRFARCVIKTMRSDRPARRSSRNRLIQEGELLTSLSHPHLVRGYEVRRHRRPVVVLETVTGATLKYLIGHRGRLVTGDLAELGTQLCSALSYLHASGFVHLDVKPGNVIVEGTRVKLIDLSLTQRPGACPRGLGTAAYLSPEQGRGEQVNEAADVWGLGATLFEAAVGAGPFDRPHRSGAAADSAADVVPGSSHEDSHLCSVCGLHTEYVQLHTRAPRVRSLRRLPAPLASAIDATLEPTPADRPTITELAETLADYA